MKLGLLGLLSILCAGSIAFAGDVITVVDENQQPVANATILFGYDTGNPFPGNTMTTDGNGLASVPGAWKADLPVTVQASGFATATIPVATPGTMTIQMNHQESATEIQIGGQTSGFGTMVDNGKVQFGMVIPALSHAQLLSFDMSTIISPQTDSITVLGQEIDLPSNITLPDQTVTYVFPVNLSKPDYRTYVRNNGQYLMTATHGNFPLAKAVTELRAGKTLFDMINDLTFVEGGTATVSVNGDVANQDMPVNLTQFNSSITVQAPTFDSSQLMVSVAMNEQNGLMLPTDLKRFTSGQSMSMKSTGSTPSVVSLLMVNANPTLKSMVEKAMDMLSPLKGIALTAPVPLTSNPQSFQQLSYTITPAAGGAAPQFLPLIDTPTLDSANHVLHFTPPTLPSGLTAVATYLVLAQIQTFPSSTIQSEARTRLWEIWSPAWLSQVELPNIPFSKDPNYTYRWEVMFLAQPTTVSGGTTNVNGVDLDSVTHVTRNSLAL